MPVVDINGIDIYYEIEGGGAPFLMIPGLAADLAIWQPVRRKFAQHFQVIMPDPPGSGRSGDCPEDMTIRDFAILWIGFLESLGIDKSHVLGQSMGGMVAQEIALHKPEVVDRLVLMSTISHSSMRTRNIIRSWRVLKERGNVREFFETVLMWLVTPESFDDEKNREAALKYMLNYPHQQSVENFRRQSMAAKSFDVRESLNTLKMKTLLVSGREDMLFTASMQRKFAWMIPGASFELIDGAGHSLLLEGAGEFSTVVLDFLLR